MQKIRVPITLLVVCAPLLCQIQNQPDDGQWPMAAKNYASTRFSIPTLHRGNCLADHTSLSLLVL